MPGLRELQRQFNDNLMDAEATDILATLHSGRFKPEQLTQIYRNNVFTSFTEALRAVYPVIEKLVGEGFFLYASNQYIHKHPSFSGNLHGYGAEFPAFLGTFEPAQGLPYLPDTARLEWHYHEVYHEADAAGLDLEPLSRADPERYDRLRFELNPASRLMQSRFPILDIWRVNQEDHEGDQAVDLDSGGMKLLLLRCGDEVEFHPLNDTEFGALTLLNQGQTLGRCVESALTIDPDYDLNQFLGKFIGNRTLTGYVDD